ncbi:hypothetical protein SAR11G3_00771 [Candidatus Pelagibacter sp. IMCC9063]|nr:hypothetical protein SAR11G3_00771 [Candidatus Pelagibacter sp. IMCC9063]
MKIRAVPADPVKLLTYPNLSLLVFINSLKKQSFLGTK